MKHRGALIDRFGLALLALNALIIIWIFVRSADRSDPAWWMGVIPFFLWTMFPVLPFCVRWPNDGNRVLCFLKRILGLAVITGALYVYFDVLFVNPDPQSGIAFVSVPVVQFFVIAAGFVTTLLFGFASQDVSIRNTERS